MADRTEATGQDLHDLFRSVFRLQAVLAQVQDLVHEQSGMSTPWKRVLHELDTAGPLTVPDVAARMDVSRQFVLKTCNDMAGAGLLEYADNPRHKRSRLVRATRRGQDVHAETMDREEGIIARILPGVSAGEVREAAALLDELRRRMRELGPEGLASG